MVATPSSQRLCVCARSAPSRTAARAALGSGIAPRVVVGHRLSAADRGFDTRAWMAGRPPPADLSPANRASHAPHGRRTLALPAAVCLFRAAIAISGGVWSAEIFTRPDFWLPRGIDRVQVTTCALPI